MPYNVQTYGWVCFILFFASFTKGFSGFGAPLFALPFLALFLDIKTVIPLVALVAFILTLILLVELREHLDWKEIYPLLIGAVPGIPLGVLLLKRLDKSAIQWALGLTLISYALYSLFLKSSNRGIKRRWSYLFGFIAGCFGGALSVSGPAVIVYTSLQNWDKDKIKVTFQGFFLISGMIVVLFHALTGLTTSTVLRFFGVSLPILILGNYLGSLLYGRIGEGHYSKVMFILLGFLGAFMIYRA